MFLIKRIYILLFLLLMFAFIIGLGVVTYISLTGVDSANLVDLKLLGERILFISLIVGILIITSYYYLINKQEDNVYEELDKVKEYSQQGNINKNVISKLGKLGEKIMLINDKLSDLNNKRVEKITSLSKELNFLYNLIDVPVFSVNMKGEIDKTSKSFLKAVDLDKKELIDKPLNDLLKDVNFNSLVQSLRQSKMIPHKSSFLTDPEGEDKMRYFVFYPIFNVKNNLANSVCIMVGKQEYERLKSNTIQDKSEEENGISPLLSRLSELHNIS